MAKYIRVDSLINDVRKNKIIGLGQADVVDVLDLVNAQPQVDIVHCKDCVYYDLNRFEDEYGCHCWSDWHFVWPNDFCSDGVRRQL